MSFSFRSALAILFATFVVSDNVSAAITVNPPQPITKHIQVQLIQTALDNGSSPATGFGTATQQAAIQSRIDTIWAQAGMDVTFLPGITRWNNTFAYQGNAGSGTRPQSDLNTVLTNARVTGGVLNSDPQVIDMFMLNVVPAFAPLSENTAAGLSYIDGNGVTGFVGDNLLTFSDGLDVIAGVFAHEIGLNLGLNEVTAKDNLMYPTPSSQKLDASQIATARASLYARAFTAPIVGDYSGDGLVDAVDYVLWRETLNQTGSGLLADGNANGRIDAGDYTVWRSRFGGSLFGTGTSLGGGSVPEPSAAAFLVLFFWPLARRARG